VLRPVHVAYMPTSIPRQDGWSLFAHTPIPFGFPSSSGVSAPALVVSGPARRLRAFRPASSPSRLNDPLHRSAPAASLPPPPLRLLPGGANQFPGGDSHSTMDRRLSRRTELRLRGRFRGFRRWLVPPSRRVLSKLGGRQEARLIWTRLHRIKPLY
jgi:hypothetical protein